MHEPYQIQRATILTPLATTDRRLSEAVKLDYMGSAEFEYGALPKSFHEIEAVWGDWKRRIVKDIEDGGQRLVLCGAMTDEEFAEYVAQLVAIREGRARTLEPTYFEAGHAKRFKLLTCDFWWDIDNGVMFSFNAAFMERLPGYVASSLRHMSQRSAKS